jgi:hypothetical protein
MIELFKVHSVANRFEHNGIVFKDVTFHWSIKRQQPLDVPSYVLPPLGPSEDEDYHRQTFVDECFTADELAPFLSWHQKYEWSNFTVNRVQIPIAKNLAGFANLGVGRWDSIIEFSATDDGKLPFPVWAYFDVSDCEVATDGSSAIQTMFVEAKELAHKWNTNGWKVETDCCEFYDGIATLTTEFGEDTPYSIGHGKITIRFSPRTEDSCA